MVLYVLIQATIAVALVAAFVRGRRALLQVTAFLLPLNGLSVYVGVNWTWSKIAPLVLLLHVLVFARNLNRTPLPGKKALLSLVVWGGALAGWYWVVDPEAQRLVALGKAVGWGPGQTDLRYAVQGAVFLMMWIGAAVVYAAVRDPIDRERFVNAFVAGNLTSICVGFYQAIAQRTGLPWFDPEALGALASGNLGLREHHSNYDVGALAVTRLYGIGGEPKHTAAFAVLALALVLARAHGGVRTRVRTSVILLLGIALTFSTSGWIAVALVLGYAAAAFARRRNVSAARNLTALGALALLGLLVSGDTRDAIFAERVSSRLQGSVATYEYKDGTFLEYAVTAPARLILGHAPGGVDFFLLPHVPASLVKPNSMLTPTYTVVRLISDVGLIGFALVGALLFAWRAELKRLGSYGRAFIDMGGIALLAAPMVAFPAFVTVAAAVLGGTIREARLRSEHASAAGRVAGDRYALREEVRGPQPRGR